MSVFAEIVAVASEGSRQWPGRAPGPCQALPGRTLSPTEKAELPRSGAGSPWGLCCVARGGPFPSGWPQQPGVLILLGDSVGVEGVPVLLVSKQHLSEVSHILGNVKTLTCSCGRCAPGRIPVGRLAAPLAARAPSRGSRVCGVCSSSLAGAGARASPRDVLSANLVIDVVLCLLVHNLRPHFSLLKN